MNPMKTLLLLGSALLGTSLPASRPPAPDGSPVAGICRFSGEEVLLFSPGEHLDHTEGMRVIGRSRQRGRLVDVRRLGKAALRILTKEGRLLPGNPEDLLKHREIRCYSARMKCDGKPGRNFGLGFVLQPGAKEVSGASGGVAVGHKGRAFRLNTTAQEEAVLFECRESESGKLVEKFGFYLGYDIEPGE